MSLTAGIIGGIGAAGSLGGAALSSNAAGKAAGTQAGASEYAANLQAQEAQQALNLQEQEYGNAQQISAPYVQAGQSGLANLENLLGVSPASNATTPEYQPQPLNAGSITDPFSGQNIGPQASYSNYGQPVTAPGSVSPTSTLQGPYSANASGTPQAAVSSPVQGGTSSIANGAPVPQNGAPASTGAAPTGGAATLSSLVNPGLGATGSLMQPWTGQFQAPTAAQAAQTPGYQFQLQQGENALQSSAAAKGGLLTGNTAAALDQYGQGLASTNYQQVYNNALTQYQQSYNQFQNNQANQFNRLADLAGLGQVSAGQLTSAGTSAAGTAGNTLLTAGQQIGQNVNNAAAATASGYVASGNAYGNALGNVGNSLGNTLSLASLLGQQNNAYQASPQSVLDYGGT